ncbi:recombinase family protein [Serratia surfactantfaciens]|uniref:recombinase family protein n=1 Tax=Serratia surfactantfaciens TaxID=2741499 RepID=UPI001E42BD02|nr:recombinase family protein [Serratia surfactantfaciens]
MLDKKSEIVRMKMGYACVSTRDLNLALQVDAIKTTACERIYQNVASGVKTARMALDEQLGQLRAEDVMVVRKYDRMGCSLRHLVEQASNLMERKVGLFSLNVPSTPRALRNGLYLICSLRWLSSNVNYRSQSS